MEINASTIPSTQNCLPYKRGIMKISRVVSSESLDTCIYVYLEFMNSDTTYRFAMKLRIWL